MDSLEIGMIGSKWVGKTSRKMRIRVELMLGTRRTSLCMSRRRS